MIPKSQEAESRKASGRLNQADRTKRRVKREELKPKISARPAGSELWSMEACSACGAGPSPLECGAWEGDSPVHGWMSAAYEPLSKSRLASECRPKWVVNFIQS
jgi:hypothetical protein